MVIIRSLRAERKRGLPPSLWKELYNTVKAERICTGSPGDDTETVREVNRILAAEPSHV